ncbi:hypothetical protein HX882_25175 [Pseudomonas gingeri]|uniref:Uncharacterized protein n=1 Tax=Pseudomonas gingeri TaxID=117681 RepID=A0A7Y7XGG6_9PSED|nr:hypothetical protein [Pseudomonas gingeri]NWB99190.1 hypothetical protein [Pseudomonas gingeri]
MFAVPLCGGIVYAVVKGMLIGWTGPALFSGFLFGSVIAIVLGIPLLLLGDRRFDEFRARHVVSGLIQSLTACLLVGATSWHLWVMSVLGGLILGVLYGVVVRWVERLPKKMGTPLRTRWGAIIAVPLSGGLTLGAAATWYLASGRAFILFFLIGGLLGVLVGWPVLWGVERFLRTDLRYIIAGMLSGLLIWLVPAASSFLAYPAASPTGVPIWPVIVFVFIGLLSGSLCLLFNWLAERSGYTKGKD